MTVNFHLLTFSFTNNMSWFLDFEGFHLPEHGFIIKEIAILNKDNKDLCYNYFIKGPKSLNFSDLDRTIQFQYQRHQLRYDFGDYEFNEAMMDIARKLKCDTVYIKGNEKYKFISNMFLSPKFVDLENVPAFKYLNNCDHERCSVKHGNCCARRKVYELHHFIINQV